VKLTHLRMDAGLSGEQAELLSWEELLRPACETLACMPASVMSSISVMGSLRDASGEPLPLIALADQLAAEYGMEAAVEASSSSFTVRFNRRDGALPAKRGD